MRKYLLLVLSGFHLAAFSQDHRANLDEVAASLVKEWQSAANQELDLHTDKAHYRLGSTIWFRTYLFNAITHLPAKSARIHVDLYRPDDSLATAILLNSASNEMDGGIKTSSKWMPGPYTIKVYTEEMALTPSVSPPLERSVYLFGADREAAPKTFAPEYKPGIGFYPEGGSLVNGIDNAVYFRSVNENGEPLSVTGFLRDDQNKIVETFKTSVPGYGKFSFMPSKNKRYQAFITMPDKTERSFPLEASSPTAWQLSLVKNTANAYVFRVAQGDSLYALKPASYVVGISNGKAAFASIGTGLYEFSVPKDNLQAGPVDFYLFDERKKLVSKRQVWVDKPNIQFNLSADKNSFASRELINLDFDLKDAKGMPLMGIFSVSVTDDRYVGRGTAVTRNEWMDITDPIAIIPAHYAPVVDSIMQVKGFIQLPNGAPATNYRANLVSTADNLFLMDTVDAKGSFQYRVPEFYDGKTFALQVTNEKGAISPVLVSTEPQYHQWISTPKKWMTDSANMIKPYLKAEADSFMYGKSMIEIRNTVAKPTGKKQPQADAHRNKSSRLITGEQLDKLGLGTTSQAVMMLPGIVMVNGMITVTGGTPTIGGTSGIEPLVIVDGVPAGNSGVAQLLNSFPPQNIESIEVMTGPEAAAYGTRGINGVIVVKTSNKLRDLPFDAKTGFQYITPVGYHDAPAFYIPPYEEPGVRYLSFLDNRSTIFWKGEVLTDKTGKARVHFYAADQPSSYTIHVKGISSRGDLIDKTISIGRK